MVHSTIKVHFLAFPSLRSLINICLCQLGHISNLSDSKDGTCSEVCLQKFCLTVKTEVFPITHQTVDCDLTLLTLLGVTSNPKKRYYLR